MNSLFAKYRQYFIANHSNIIVEVSDSLCCLTQYSKKDLIGNTIHYIFHSVLRIASDYDFGQPSADTYLFTKTLQVRHVHIEKTTDRKTRRQVYHFYEIPNSRFEEKNLYVEQLISENVLGVGVYTPGLILVKANRTYLDCLPEPLHTREAVYGKTICEIVPDFQGSDAERQWHEIIKNQKSLYIRECHGLLLSEGGRYWDNTITPLVEDNRVTYLVSVLQDVTERVLRRCFLADLKEKYETLLDNMSDGMVALDGEGNYIYVNKRLSELGRKYRIENYGTEKYYDVCGRQIPSHELPRGRVIRGEEVKNQRFMIKRDGAKIYFECNSNLVHDRCGRLKLAVLNFRDVTKAIENEYEMRHQKDELDALLAVQERLIDTIEEKNTILNEAMAYKDEFLYLITHEMKTPLAIIRSALQTMDLVCGPLTGRAAKYLSTIKQNTNRQLRLVNTLLEIIKIDSGQIKLNNEQFDIVSLTRLIVNSIKPIAKQKGINILFHSEINKKILFIDEEKVERILLNLLSNALKFTPENKEINVKIHTKKENRKRMVYISVQDEGIGIPPEKQSIIFERFGQADTKRSRPQEGTGIGLYLVRLLVEAMGGFITLESKEGIGSNFTVMLPDIKPDRSIITEKKQPDLSSNESRLTNELAIQFSDIYY